MTLYETLKRIDNFYRKLQGEIDFFSNKYTNGVSELSKDLLTCDDLDKKTLTKLLKELAPKTPLAKKRSLVFLLLAFQFKHLTKDKISKKILTIFAYKFFNLHMNRYFPQGVDPIIWDLTKQKIDKRSYLKKYEIFAMLQFLGDDLYHILEKAKTPDKLGATMLKQLVTIRNKLNQIIKTFARKYYKIFKEEKERKQKEEQPKSKYDEDVSLELLIRQGILDLKNESESYLSNLIKKQNKRIEISPKFIVYLIKQIKIENLDFLSSLFEKLIKDTTITEKNLYQVISKNPKYSKDKTLLGEWILESFRKNKKMMKKVLALNAISKRRITKYFLLTLYRVI